MEIIALYYTLSALPLPLLLFLRLCSLVPSGYEEITGVVDKSTDVTFLIPHFLLPVCLSVCLFLHLSVFLCLFIYHAAVHSFLFSTPFLPLYIRFNSCMHLSSLDSLFHTILSLHYTYYKNK